MGLVKDIFEMVGEEFKTRRNTNAQLRQQIEEMQEELSYLSAECFKKQEAVAKDKAATSLTASRLKKIREMDKNMHAKIQSIIQQQISLKTCENYTSNIIRVHSSFIKIIYIGTFHLLRNDD